MCVTTHPEQRPLQATVGIPVHNAMPWLPEAVESLLRQTTNQFEILVIVDGGTDGSLAWLRSLREPRLRVIHQPHAGVTATLNRLLAETRTPWLIRQDADDVSWPRRIEILLSAIRAWPDAGLIYSLAHYHPAEKCAGKFRCSRGTPEQLRSTVERGYLLSICHSTAALHVERARAAGGYRMDIHAEDADLWWRIARRFPIRCIPEPLVGFRQHPGSISALHAEQQQLAGLYVQYLLLSDLWGFVPRPLPLVAETLRRFLQPSRIAAKESLRQLNIHLSQGRRLRAAGAFAQAVCRSPRFVFERIRDELWPSAISNGVPPRLFQERKDLLWS